MSEPACPLCDKLAHLNQLGDELVWRFPHSVAFLGTWQYYRGYCVLVSKQHAHELIALAEDVRRAYLDEMCLLARAIADAFGPHKLNYELLGNQLSHPHWHLFPRSLDDPARRSPVWLAIDAAERDPAQRSSLEGNATTRATTIARLRQVMTSLGAPSA
jgi:diadenosine tetraphosphate (Ap4A) HIT family hydrolase